MTQSTSIPAFIESIIDINAPVGKIWQALTDPAFTRQYMFGCNVVSHWEIGGPVSWVGSEGGVMYVDGKLIQYEPEKLLEFTVIDPNASYANTPNNHLHVKYTILSKPGSNQLQVRQGDFTSVAEGEKRYTETIADGGWEALLNTIKEIVEAG